MTFIAQGFGIEEVQGGGGTIPSVSAGSFVGTGVTPAFLPTKRGLRNRSKSSHTLGPMDPRHRRNDQAGTKGDDYVYPLGVDLYGRLGIDLENWLDFHRKYAVTIGDGVTKNFSIRHRLNTQDIHVSVYRVSDGAAVTAGGVLIYDSLALVDDNTFSLTFDPLATAPAQDDIRVVVVK